ncbi:hypothetical protein QNH16_09035 [Peribacillus frigoritolerans]|uniref:hypothetical protein n=1 Tax=Peribacillus frigoritolerans TaxID=450367 RepID=UPI0024C0D944|nr:hypothetical protein [Peribacillus frigoritolerans]WHY15764.1 hypothetical protein QNH16_09035 [Peribacillus frigoritolerans]
MDIPGFDYLRPTFILLNLILLIVLTLILINPKRYNINYFYIISVSVICILTTATLYIALGFMIDEFSYGMDNLSVGMIFTIFGLSLLNPIIYKFKK